MRVFLAWSDHYDGKYSDPLAYQSLYLTHRAGSEDIYAYVRRDAPAWAQIRDETVQGMKTPVNLILSFDPDVESGGPAYVVEFLHKFWISPDDAGAGTGDS